MKLFGFTQAQLSRLGPTLASLAISGPTVTMLREMYYSPTHCRPMAYRALADWCEEFGNENQRRVCEPAREVAELLASRDFLNSYGLLVRTLKKYRHTYRLVIDFLPLPDSFWYEADVLGSKTVSAFHNDRVCQCKLIPGGVGTAAGPGFLSNNAFFVTTSIYYFSVNYADTQMIAIGRRGNKSSRNRRFGANEKMRDHGEIRLHPLLILWYALEGPGCTSPTF